MILASLIFSTVLCFFSNSWVTVWIVLEINTLSFCSVNFMKTGNEKKQTKEMTFKYLLVQSIASSILIVSCLLKETKMSFLTTVSILILGALMIKMGASPFHYWFIAVTKKMSWSIALILFTWQKLMPLYLISYVKKSSLFIFVLFSSITGSIFLLNKKSMKEIMALSSIFNLGWMLAAIVLNLKLLLLFSVLYWISLFFFIKDLTNNKNSNLEEIDGLQTSKFILFLKSANLGGIPPLMGFLAKWLVFSNLLKVKMFIASFFMLILSSLNIFIYLRMSSKPLLQNSLEKQKPKKSSTSFMDVLFLTLNMSCLQLYI